jgi:hypothetical protein
LENDRRVAKSTRKFTRKFLIEAYAFLKSEPAMHSLIASGVTSDTTYSELMKFATRHRAQIEELKKAYEKQRRDAQASQV